MNFQFRELMFVDTERFFFNEALLGVKFSLVFEGPLSVYYKFGLGLSLE